MKRLLIATLCLLATGVVGALAQKHSAVIHALAAVTVTQSQTLNITLTGAFPTSVACNPAAPLVPANVPTDTVICALSATLADGTPFAGKFGLTGATAQTPTNPGMFKISTDGKSVATARALTPADLVGSPFALTMSATQ